VIHTNITIRPKRKRRAEELQRDEKKDLKVHFFSQ